MSLNSTDYLLPMPTLVDYKKYRNDLISAARSAQGGQGE
jgi:hypothetical protein